MKIKSIIFLLLITAPCLLQSKKSKDLIIIKHATCLNWLTVTMSLLETSERLARDKRETRERLERDYREMELWLMA